MDNQELNPELKKMLESLQDVPERNLQASHVGRENYLTQVRSLKPRRRVSRKSARQGAPRGQRGWVTRFATIAALVFVVALSSLGGTVYAAQAAQPDDLLYGVKILTEEIQVYLESDPEDKLDLYMSFANRRMEEIQAQVAAGEEVSEQTLALLERHTNRMLELAANMHEFGMDKALHQIETNLQMQNQMMVELGEDHTKGSSPVLLRTHDKIRQRLELVELGIKDLEGFRERMRSDPFDQQGDGKEDNPGDPEGGQNGTEMPGNTPGSKPGK